MTTTFTPTPTPSTVQLLDGRFLRVVKGAPACSPMSLEAAAVCFGVPVDAAADITERLALRGLVRVFRPLRPGALAPLHVAPKSRVPS